LIIRQQDKIRHVLPLHNAGWRRYQQKHIILAQASKQEQDAIVEMRRQLGNRLSFDVREDQVTSISLQHIVKGDAALAHLEQFPLLNGLSFTLCRDLAPDELRPLKTLTQLERLSFRTTPVSDAVLAHLVPLEHLKSLEINDSLRFASEKTEDTPHISDVGLESLAHLVTLEKLSLCGPGVTDAGLKHLHKLKALKRLYFQATGVTLAGLYDLSKQLPDTEIQAAPLPTQNGRDTCSFKIHGKRQAVWVMGRPDDSVLQQCAKCDGITSLSFSGLHAVTDEGLGDIAKMNDLEGLVIQHAKLITDDGLSQLKHQKNLKSLNLWCCKSITDKGLEHLYGLTELKSLQLGGTQVTQAGINRLQKALPACEIEK
jgi:internalin A